MQRLLYILTVLVVTFWGLLPAQGQTGRQGKLDFAISEGNRQFELAYFNNAITFYNDALAIDEDNLQAHYQLGECYRHLYQYNKAAAHYQKVAERNLVAYPGALFYVAQIQKLNGQYKQAISTFEQFMAETHQIPKEKFPRKHTFFEKALTEMEGCYWVLEQQHFNQCFNLMTPVNTPANDFAPVITQQHDSLLLLVSGRSANMLELHSDAGEAYTDFFFFGKDGTAWNNLPLPDKFDKQINTKFNEGSGCFNAAFNAFYFTTCGGESPHCAIYVSHKINGKWQKPEKLPESINLPFSDNMQPALSVSGDTLFFTSNRPENVGGKDIWFSVKTNGEWGEAQNMGYRINTPFDEMTPFYYNSAENGPMLFFASNGHTGFGGLDIFRAKGDDLRMSAVKNMGAPFNSNLDDCFFVMGPEKGYLSSNRAGGEGLFDVYGFDNLFLPYPNRNYTEHLQELRDIYSSVFFESDRPVSDAGFEPVIIELPEMLVSKNDQNNYDRINSNRLAGYIYKVKMPLMETDYQLYENMSLDDKSIADMLYEMESLNLQPHTIDSLKKEDQWLYNELMNKDKDYGDRRILKAFIETPSDSVYVGLNSRDREYYKNLSIEEKQRLDRLIAYRLRLQQNKIDNAPDVEEIFTDKLNIGEIMASGLISDGQNEEYERILSVMLAGYIHGFEVRFTQSDYNRHNPMSIDDKSIIDMLHLMRIAELHDTTRRAMREADMYLYESYPAAEKEYIDQMVEAYISTPKEADFVELPPAVNRFYTSLSLEEKRETDRLMVYRLRDILISPREMPLVNVVSDPIFDSGLIDENQQQQYEKFASMLFAGFLYDIKYHFSEKDYQQYSSLSPDDKGFIDVLFNSLTVDLKPEDIEALHRANGLFYDNMPAVDKLHINSIADAMFSTPIADPFVFLNRDDKNYLDTLPPGKLQKIHRLIAHRLWIQFNTTTETFKQFADAYEDELGIKELSGEDGVIPTSTYLHLERLLAFRSACFIHNLQLPYLQPDYEVYQTFGIEEISLFDMMYSARILKLQEPLVIDAIRHSDDNAYERLPAQDKKLIDYLVESYLQGKENKEFIPVEPRFLEKYNALTLEEKYRTDRLFVARLRNVMYPVVQEYTAEDALASDALGLKEISQNTGLISAQQFTIYERILANWLASFIHGVNMPLTSEDAALYHSLSIDDLSLLDMAYKIRLIKLNTFVTDSLRNADRETFQKLDAETKQWVTAIGDSYLELPPTSEEIVLPPEQSEFYQQLDLRRKYSFDRFLAAYIYDKRYPPMTEIVPEGFISEKETNSYERILSVHIAAYIYGVDMLLTKPDYMLFQELTIDDKSLIDMMLVLYQSQTDAAGIDSLIRTDARLFELLSDAEQQTINRIASAYSLAHPDDDFVRLYEEDAAYYRNLSLKEKQQTDRFIAHRLQTIYKAREESLVAYEDIVEDELGLQEFNETGLFSKGTYEAIERILAFRVAAYVHDVDQPMVGYDYELKKNMTIDDLSLLDMMYASKIVDLQEKSVVEAVQKADEQAFENLPDDEQAFINRIVNAYITAPEETPYINLPEADAKRYRNLETQQKYKTDRLLMSQIRLALTTTETVEEQIEVSEITYTSDDLELAELAKTNSSVISMDDYNAYERILAQQIAEYIYGVDVPLVKPDYELYQELSIDDLSLLDMMFLMRTAQLKNEAVKEAIRTDDQRLFNQLSDEDKTLVNTIAQALFDANENADYITVNQEMAAAYNAVPIEKKYETDRLILHRLYGLLHPTESIEIQKLNITEDDLSNDLKEIAESSDLISAEMYDIYERTLSVMVAGFIYEMKMPLISADYQRYDTLSIDDLSMIDMIYVLRTADISQDILEHFKNEDRLIYRNLPLNERQITDRLARAYINQWAQPYISITASDLQFYTQLSILEKNKFDRLIASRINQLQTAQDKTLDDLFSFSLASYNCTMPQIEGRLNRSQNSGAVEGMSIALLNQLQTVVATTTTGTGGKFDFASIPANTAYSIVLYEGDSIGRNNNMYFVTDFNIHCNDTQAAATPADTIVITQTTTQREVVAGAGLGNVFFGFNESTLSNDARTILDNVVYYYETHPSAQFLLEAFTDNVGSEKYNMQLSEHRAQVVKNYLINNGIPAPNIQTEAKGEAAPIVPNTSPKGHALNRRVQIQVIK